MPMEGGKTMLDYLKTVFGDNIIATEFDYPNNSLFIFETDIKYIGWYGIQINV